jgi:large subunit ribosomal protein L19
MKKIEKAIKPFLKKDVPDVQPGDTVKVFQILPSRVSKKGSTDRKGKNKERIQVFEGIVLAKKHNKEIGATITVRKVVGGIGVERIFPLHLPTIKKIEIIKRSKVRRAKLYYLRKAKGKRARLKRKEFTKVIPEDVKSSDKIVVNQKKLEENPASAKDSSFSEASKDKSTGKEEKEEEVTEKKIEQTPTEENKKE